MSKKGKTKSKLKPKDKSREKVIEVYCSDCGLIFDWNKNESGTCPDCEERENIALHQINEMAITDNFNPNNVIKYKVCAECNTTYNEKITLCPYCHINSNSYVIPNFSEISEIKKANAIAKEAWRLATTHHSIISFVSHYMVLNHFIWSFVNDMIKGVIPNTRVTPKDKMEYVSNFFGYLDAEGSSFIDSLEDMLINDSMVFQRYKLVISDGDKVVQSEPRLYYDSLENDEASTTKVLEKLIWNHANMNLVLEHYISKIELDDSNQKTDAQKFEEIATLVKRFSKLSIL